MNDFYFKLLILEIKDICITIHRFKNTSNCTVQKIMQILPPNICQRFFELESKKAQRIFLTHRQIRESKFENLIDKRNKRNNMSKNVENSPDHALIDSGLTNLTDIHIPLPVAKTVSLGENFGVPVPNNHLAIKHLVADFESNIHKINEDDRNAARFKFLNCISIFSRLRQSQNPLSNFQKNMIQNAKLSHTFSKNNPNILITNADKGNITVALDKNKYIEEVKTMLSEKKTYIPLKKRPHKYNTKQNQQPYQKLESKKLY